MPNDKLDKAVKECKAYRKYLKDQKIPAHLATKGFLLTKEMIDNLMKQSGATIEGIRIYVGLDETGEKTIRPYAVGCVKNGEKYNDYKIPNSAGQAVDPSMAATTTATGGANTTPTSLSTSEITGEPVLEEPRPCPHECGDNNDLNSGE